MTRYVRQRDHSRCGPVALLNLSKWQGKKATYKDIKRFEKKCKWTQNGVSITQMARAIGKRPRRLSLKQFRKHLQQGHAILIYTSLPKSHWAHYYLAVGFKDNCYILINHYWGQTICLVYGKYLLWVLKHSQIWIFRSNKVAHTAVEDARRLCG